VALRVADLERATRFYSELLGLPVRARHADDRGEPRSVWLAAGDAILMLERTLAGVGPETGSGHLLALAVEDLAEWEAKLGAASVPIEGRTRFTLYFRDPDGHRVGLSTYRATGGETG
jgi:catechol 2,3-dioxygenase-like lactoylglutathione lyase family enzyme